MTMPANSKITIAASVWARSDDEAARLRAALTVLSRFGLPVVLADNGSTPDFVSAVSALPNITVLPKPDTTTHSLTEQMQRAFRNARESKPDWILYSEPDKQWFFENRLAQFVEHAERFPDADVVIPCRNRESFETFPAYQRKMETTFNKIAAEWLGNSADVLYGPLLLRPDLTRYLDDLSENVGWGWRPYLLAIAKRTKRYPVRWIDAFPCPPDQRGEDNEPDRLHRMRQLAQNMTGLALGFSMPLDTAKD